MATYKTIWRKLNYSSSDGVKQSTDIIGSDNYENDLIEAKKQCKSKARIFKSLSKTKFNSLGEKVK
jgi:hypothetical protein